MASFKPGQRLASPRLSRWVVGLARKLAGAHLTYVACPPDLAGDLGGLTTSQWTEADQTAAGATLANRQRVIDNSRRLGAAYPALGQLLNRVCRSELGPEIADYLVLEASQTEATAAAMLEDFCAAARQPDGLIVLDPFAPGLIDWRLPAGVRVVGGVSLPERLRRLLARIGLAGAMLLLPALNLALVLKKGIRPGKAPVHPRRRFLFVHRYAERLSGLAAYYRENYLFKAGCLDYGDCRHVFSGTGAGLADDKIAVIDAAGGDHLAFSQLRPRLGTLIGETLGQWPAVIAALPGLVGHPALGKNLFLGLFQALHYVSLSRFLMDQATEPTLVFENETSLLGRVMATEARRRGRPAVSMAHGVGAHITPALTRLGLTFDHFLTYGQWVAPLQSISPHVANLIPVGNIEVERAATAEDWMPGHLRRQRDQKRLIGFFARLDHVLNPSGSLACGSVYPDPTPITEALRAWMAPLLDWIAADPSLVLVWKSGWMGPPNWPEWGRDLMDAIPAERLILVPEAALTEVIPDCDVTIGNDASSAIATSLSFGVPSVSMDLGFDRIFGRYDPRYSAATGDELLSNVQALIGHAVDEAVRRKIDHDMNGPLPEGRAPKDQIKTVLDQFPA